jgi:hypothetical protein
MLRFARTSPGARWAFTVVSISKKKKSFYHLHKNVYGTWPIEEE